MLYASFANSTENIFIDEKNIIVDEAKLLSFEGLKDSNTLIKSIREQHNIKVYLVTSDTSYGLSAEDFKNEIVSKWNLNSDLIILIAIIMEDNIVVAHLSDDLKNKVSNEDIDLILTQIMATNFQKGNFENGIIKTLKSINNHLSGKSVASIISEDEEDTQNQDIILISLFIISLLALFIIAKKNFYKPINQSKKPSTYKNRQ